MDIEEAKRMGYKTVYFTFDCIGDTILLMSALGYLYQKHNQKFLVGTHYKEIIENCHYIDVLDEFYEDNFGLENYYKLLINDINPIFISATSFRIEDQKIKPIWGRKHILVNICSKIGFEGYIEIAPRIFLNDEEKSYGRFFEASQIAIISTGNQPYKSMPTNVAQTIVDNLKHRYNFVQVGSASDPLLIGALDKRGDGGIRRTAAILHNSDLFVGELVG